MREGERSSGAGVVKRSARDVLITSSGMCAESVHKCLREREATVLGLDSPQIRLCVQGHRSLVTHGALSTPLNQHKLPHTFSAPLETWTWT